MENYILKKFGGGDYIKEIIREHKKNFWGGITLRFTVYSFELLTIFEKYSSSKINLKKSYGSFAFSGIFFNCSFSSFFVLYSILVWLVNLIQ